MNVKNIISVDIQTHFFGSLPYDINAEDIVRSIMVYLHQYQEYVHKVVDYFKNNSNSKVLLVLDEMDYNDKFFDKEESDVDDNGLWHPAQFNLISSFQNAVNKGESTATLSKKDFEALCSITNNKNSHYEMKKYMDVLLKSSSEYDRLIDENPDKEDLLKEMYDLNVPHAIADVLMDMDIEFQIERKEYGYMRDGLDTKPDLLGAISQIFIETGYDSQSMFDDFLKRIGKTKKIEPIWKDLLKKYSLKDIQDCYEYNYLEMEIIEERYNNGFLDNSLETVFIGGGAGECLLEERCSYLKISGKEANTDLKYIYGDTVQKMLDGYSDFSTEVLGIKEKLREM